MSRPLVFRFVTHEVLPITDQLRRWHAEGALVISYEPKRGCIASVLDLSKLPPDVAATARAVVPQHIEGDVLKSWDGSAVRERTGPNGVNAVFDPMTSAASLYMRLAEDLHEFGYRIDEMGNVSTPTPEERAFNEEMNRIFDTLTWLHADGSLKHTIEPGSNTVVSSLPAASFHAAIVEAWRASHPEGVVGGTLRGETRVGPAIAQELDDTALKSESGFAVRIHDRLAADLYNLGYRPVARVAELTSTIERFHRDGVLTLAYNDDRSEVSSRLPLSALPEAAVKAAREAHPDAIGGDALTGRIRIGATLREEREEGEEPFTSDASVAPGGAIARMFTQKLATELLSLGF